MKIFALTGLSALAALAVAAAAPPAGAQPHGDSSDRDPCQQKQHNAGTAGALIGGAAGAAIGNSVSHGGGRTGGTIIGGVAGAVIGDNVGRRSAKSSDACRYGYYDPRRYAHTYSTPGYDAHYGYNTYYPPVSGYAPQPYRGRGGYSAQPYYGRDYGYDGY